ncbi:MAG: MBL fold metallo-hydrolase [Gammaproteobacteria bacterium]|nr:MBL fold metallo-hydrolase [Gammaproteobacteria bacterium]
MRILISAFLLLLSPFVLAKEIPDYPAKKIAPHTYMIEGPLGLPNAKNKGFMNNPVFVVTKTGVVVIDPGTSVYTGRMVLRQIRKVTKNPVTHVLDTHIHGDHWLGNQAFSEAYPKAILMAHPKMIAQANAGEAKQWLSLMSQLTKGATDGTKAVVPDKAIDNQHQFKTGGITFKILAPKKAHSGTDIMIHIVEDKVLVLGDNVLHKRIGRMDDATFRGNINACDVAINSGAKVFVPGHGPSGDVHIVKKYRTYLSTIFESVKVYIDEGLNDYEMKAKIHEKLEPFIRWSGYKDQLGKHISLAMLEAEKAMFE